MEIQAALEAMRALPGALDVVSDSTYVVNCFRDRWWEGWIARGWLNKAKKPVANRDLWEPLIELVRADPSRVRWQWVKGHSDDPANDVVDRLAADAARTQTGRSGTGTPTDLGPADDPSSDVDPRVPAGRRVVVAGHRPPELGGYDANATADGVRRQITEVLAAKKSLHPDLVVMTGLGLGAEQLGAEAALEAGAPLVAVLPYPEQESVWPESSRARYRELLAQARATVLLQARAPETRQKAGAALARRDAWLVRNADEAIVVWDGDDDRVGKLVRTLEEQLPDDVWIIAPAPAG
jgi:uncharacterized phage-like protein YoqJ